MMVIGKVGLILVGLVWVGVGVLLVIGVVVDFLVV